MLTRNTTGINEKTKRQKLIVQRRIMLVLLTFLSIAAFTILTKTAIDIVKQNRAEDILVSAQQEANQILSEAEVSATMVKQVATKDANEKADTITKTAEVKADTITKTAEVKAESITQTAEVKADKIVDNAINTKIDEVQTLLAITEAEAGNQSVKGKAAVAAVIKNRVGSDKFKADSIKEVVYAPGQFDPVSNGTIENVKPSPDTLKAVMIALEGTDYSNGALYFYNPTISRGGNASWFNSLRTTTVIGDHVFKK